MFKSVARAQILVAQVGEVRDGGSRRMGGGDGRRRGRAWDKGILWSSRIAVRGSM